MNLAARYALTLLALASPLHADRIVVDSSGCADFLDIQPAINSALDGDLIEVRSGSYGLVLMVDKEWVLTTGNGASAVGINGTIRLSGLSAGKAVVLSGLTNLTNSNLPDDGLLICNCAGSVRVQDCAFSGYRGGPIHTFGCRIQGSDDVEMSSVSFTGGRGGTGSSHPTMRCNGSAGGSVLVAQASEVLLRAGSIAPGLGGGPTRPPCMTGPDGFGIESLIRSTVRYLGPQIADAQLGTIQQLPALPRGWTSLHVFVNTNAPFPLSIYGQTGDRVVLLSSLANQYRSLPGLVGNLAIGAPYQGQFLGICDAFGSLQTVGLYLVPGGGQSEHQFAQTLHFPSDAPTRALGNGRVSSPIEARVRS